MVTNSSKELNRPTRVGFYLGRMSGPGSGAWTWLYALLDELNQRQEIDIVIFVPESMQKNFNSFPVISVIAMEQTNALLSLVTHKSRLRKLVREHQLDALHLCSLPISRNLSCKVFYTLHDLRAYYPKAIGGGSSKDVFRKLFYKFMVKRADAIVCPSSWAKVDISEKLNIDSKRILVVPQMLNTLEKYRRLEATREPNSPRYVLALGHIEVRKNLETLIRATQTDLWPSEIILRIVGKDVGDRERLEGLYQLDPRNRVMFEPEIDESQKSELISNAEIVLVPSHIEGFGIVTVEAILLGVPALVSDQTALPEVVGTPDSIVEVMNVQEWAFQVRELCTNPVRRINLLTSQQLALSTRDDEEKIDGLLKAYAVKTSD